MYPEQKSSEFDSTNNPKLWDHLKNLMQVDSIQEIIIEVPKNTLPPDRTFMASIEFLDLIGMPDPNLEYSVKWNSLSIARENIDCIFVFGSRGNCSCDDVKNLWKIGAFSNLSDVKPPKLVAARKVRSNECTSAEEFAEFAKNFANKSIKNTIVKSLRKSFEFYEEHDEDVQNVIDDPPLEMENKRNNLNEIIARVDCILIAETHGSPKVYEKAAYSLFKKDLANIYDDIVLNKQDSQYRIAFDYLQSILKQLELKLNFKIIKLKRGLDSNRMYSINGSNKMSQMKIDEYFQKSGYSRKEKSFLQELNEISIELDDESLDEPIVYDDEYDNEILRNGIRKNQYMQHCIDKMTTLLCKYTDEVLCDLKRGFKCYDWNSFRVPDKMYYLVKIKRDFLLSKNKDYSVLIRIIAGIIKDFKFIFYTGQNAESIRSNQELNHSIEAAEDLFRKLNVFEDDIKQLLNCKHISTGSTMSLSNFPRVVRYRNKNSNQLPNLIQWQDYERHGNVDYHPGKVIKHPFNALSEPLVSGKQKSKINLIKGTKAVVDFTIHFKIDRINRQVICDYDEAFLQRKLNLLLKNIYKFESDQKEGDRALYPIFSSSNKIQKNELKRSSSQTDLEEEIRTNTLVNCLGSHLGPEHFLVFQFVEASHVDYFKAYCQNEFSAICDKNKDFDARNKYQMPTIVCRLPDTKLTLGMKKKLMMLFAEHLKLRRFYFIDDDIEGFYEYNPRSRDIQTHSMFAFKALSFMLKVLESELEEDEEVKVDDDTQIRWITSLSRIENQNKIEKKLLENTVKEIQKFVLNKNFKEKNKLVDLINILDKLDYPVLREIKSVILGKKAKIIGHISLLENASYQFRQYFDRLTSEPVKRITTHLVSSQRSGVSLYSLDAIEKIHHVSDSVLFESFNSDQAANGILEDATLGKRDNLIDKVHVYNQILNCVSGFMVYYYSAKKCEQVTIRSINENTSFNSKKLKTD